MKKYRISNDSILPELRRTGKFIRRFNYYYTERKFRLINKIMGVSKGKWLGKNTVMEEQIIKGRDGNDIRVCVCKSKKETCENATGLLWIHGGGFAIGAPEQDFRFVENFLEEHNCIVVVPDYRKSTEAPYPAALNDCYDTLLWMKDNAKILGINEKQIFVGGDSAGGNLTAAVTLLARDEKKVDIAFQMPFYPMLDDRMITESSKNNDAPVWNSVSNEIAWKMYLRDCKDTVSKYAAPARETDFSNLPPMCTYIGSIDPFYDETKEYVANMKKAAVEVFFKEFEGCYHGFDIVCPKAEVTKRAREFYLDAFRYAQKNYFSK